MSNMTFTVPCSDSKEAATIDCEDPCSDCEQGEQEMDRDSRARSRLSNVIYGDVNTVRVTVSRKSNALTVRVTVP
jgi:hypothetical protein